MQFEYPCPECGSEDLARYVNSGIGTGSSPKSNRRKIDRGCMINAYEYHCWSCEEDFESLDPDHHDNVWRRKFKELEAEN